MSNENIIQSQVRVTLSKYGIPTFRNNSGVMIRPDGIPVRFGLGNESPIINKIIKSPDIIGIIPYTGQFLAVECKPSNWKGIRNDRERAQEQFIKIIIDKNGIGFFAKSTDCVHYELQRQLHPNVYYKLNK